MNICNYYSKLGFNPFKVAIPVTFHIKKQSDTEYKAFIKYYNELKRKNKSNVWIIKPGENSNRGCGIEVSKNL